MQDYKLVADTTYVIRTSDGVTIPSDEGNRDWVEYLKWLEQGNIPDPADPITVVG